MKRAARQIALMTLLLLVICVVSRVIMRNTYTAYLPIPEGMRNVGSQGFRVTDETPGIIDHGEPDRVDDNVRLTIQPRQPGEVWVDLDGKRGEDLGLFHFRVTPLGTIYDSATGGFTGDSIALAAVTVFFLAVAAIMFYNYRQMKGPAFYAYETIYAVGFGLFALLTGLFMLVITVRHLLNPRDYIMLTAYDAISSSGFRFMMITAPMMLIFAVAMIVSNIALLKHEPFSFKNILGIGIGVALIAGEALAYWLYTRDFVGSEWQMRIHNTLQDVYTTGFSYFECILIGAVVCGVKAARHVPDRDADYILILGCRLRRDGTLTPLLQGRVDRAISFWRMQREETGREAVLMPSGGQGSDEVIAEAEAMRRYLVDKGIPNDLIRVEDRSRNTYQNMEFSKQLIDREKQNAKVAYATTNYHVFRSGVWASLAGMPAEGMGSRTKWWYWPNAFMGECVGLLVNRIPQELLLLAAMVALFGTLSIVLG